ncbi:MAG: FemAB family XrtA/PEP-CTERM system-associated protein [Longimicrobiales bacterium]
MIRVSTSAGANEVLRRFLRHHPDSTLCHHPEWPAVIRGALGCDGRFYVATADDGTIEGAMPAARVKSLLFGDHLVSLPFINGGGPVGTPEAVGAILDEVRKDAEDAGVDVLEVRTAQELPGEWRPDIRKITVKKDLPSTADELWQEGIRSKVRSQIRRPQREGCSITVGRSEVRAFYQVYSTNMRDLGTPVLPLRFFEAINERLSDMAVFATVRQGGQPLAAGCGFLWRDQFEITWASSLRSHNRIAPNMLLYWGLMEHVLSERNAAVFDFGRCTEGSTTHRFKKQWGTYDVPLPWLAWARRSGNGLPKATDPKFQLATRVWSRLPLTVANRVGPLLSTRIP